MTTRDLKIGDKNLGVSVHFDPNAGAITIAHAQTADPLTFTATLRVAPGPLRQEVDALCAAAAQEGARTTEMLFRLTRLAARTANAFKYVRRPVQEFLAWTAVSKEHTNYSYDLHPRNVAYLAATVALATSKPVKEIEGYVREAVEDEALRQHYRNSLGGLGPELAAAADSALRLGRRLGWYAVVRAVKPKYVVETGVDKGHGALVLCAALTRNAAEDAPGHYIGTDINPAAGYLLSGPYAQHGKILYGDSIGSLKTLREPVDVFINDSDHSAEYEYAEYQAISPLLHAKSVVLGDNAHVTDKLLQFASETQRRFAFFREEPVDHWYPGAGIGFAFT